LEFVRWLDTAFRFVLDPLTRLASADESASSSHPLPQGGEGTKINSSLAAVGREGPGS